MDFPRNSCHTILQKARKAYTMTIHDIGKNIMLRLNKKNIAILFSISDIISDFVLIYLIYFNCVLMAILISLR